MNRAGPALASVLRFRLVEVGRRMRENGPSCAACPAAQLTDGRPEPLLRRLGVVSRVTSVRMSRSARRLADPAAGLNPAALAPQSRRATGAFRRRAVTSAF